MSPLPTLVRPAARLGLDRLRPGGSAWWYLDACDPDGNGFVLVAALGLPFVPGYASAARAGAALDPRDGAAVVLSTLKAGRPDFYAFHTAPRQSVRALDDRLVIGDSTVSVVRDHGRTTLHADLAGSLPGCAWRASIRFEGPSRLPESTEVDRADHEWTVLSCGQAHLRLRAGGETTRIGGDAYLDRNLSTTWLDAMGTRGWHWGRARSGDDVNVWYAADGPGGRDTHLLRIAPHGRTFRERDPVVDLGSVRGGWGLPRPAGVEAGPRVHALDHPIDDSPFYTRLLLRDGDRAVGFAEVCRADRIDRPWSRPLVRMAVASAEPSPWLPLFSGPRAGRLRRLFGVRP